MFQKPLYLTGRGARASAASHERENTWPGKTTQPADGEGLLGTMKMPGEERGLGMYTSGQEEGTERQRHVPTDHENTAVHPMHLSPIHPSMGLLGTFYS